MTIGLAFTFGSDYSVNCSSPKSRGKGEKKKKSEEETRHIGQSRVHNFLSWFFHFAHAFQSSGFAYYYYCAELLLVHYENDEAILIECGCLSDPRSKARLYNAGITLEWIDPLWIPLS